MIKNKKAQGLSLTTIIIALLAMLVLVIIALIFSGAMGDVSQRIRDFFATKTCDDVGGSEEDVDPGCPDKKVQYIGFLKELPQGKICCVPKGT